ncbi:ATP-binding protein [Thermococcus henrietii]|uniref:PD-(D/E)XK nuclease family protein n=1 Tax=Thermococcus henrietii TaxID=2016361 RepID=UPI000C07C1DC|nr:PD-(D/E)XK nuclease family protein [Thermococcus henrietii]
MGWRRFLALALVLLFLGMTVSGASATANLVNNSTVNDTVKVPQNFSVERKQGNNIKPQFAWVPIGIIVLDQAAHWFLERYVSPKVASVYDAVTMVIDPEKIAEKLGIKGTKLGIKVISHSKVLIGLFKDNKVVKEITYASKEAAEWVANKLGNEYISKIVEKYVVKDGGLKKGEDFDSVVGAMQKLYDLGIKSKDARKYIIDRGWNVKKLERILDDVSNIDNGGKKLIKRINADLRDEKTLGPLYEAEVVSHLKKSGWTIDEVEKDVVTSAGKTEIDIIVEKGSETVLIECKRNAHKISEEQLAKYAEYAIIKGIRKIEVYYAGGIENIRDYYYYTQYLPKEIKSRFGVDVEVRYLASEFD